MTKVFLDSADPIVIRDLEGRILDANHEVERVFGWTREELLGQPAGQFLAPEWRELADRTLQQCQRGEAVRNVEFAVRAKGGVLVPILATAFLLTDEKGEPVAIANILKDIAQLKQTTEKLQQRNAQLQQFANVLAHDLAAPLRTICSFAELLEEECSAKNCSEDFRDNLQCLIDGANRMDAMIADLLEYVRIEHQETSLYAVDSKLALQQAIDNLHSAIQESGAEVTYDPLPTVQANEIQLVHVFQNLIGNAIKFARDDPPRIHVDAEQVEQAWRFSVRDNGIGMDAKDLTKIFDVFRRLHAQNVFPGTGIGLAICKAVVERHGGRIWAESEKGVGSVFYFTIPHGPAE
jgi:PAS domain S-box-containing protein